MLGNPLGGLVRVDVEVGGVGGSVVAPCADRIGVDAVGAEQASPAVERSQLIAATRELAVLVGARLDVVGLVSDVTSVTPEEGCDDCRFHVSTSVLKMSKLRFQRTLVAWGAVGVKTGVGLLRAVPELATTTAQDVTHRLSSLRVAGQDELRAGALLVVCGDLVDSQGGADVEGIAGRAGGVVVLDLLYCAAGEVGADLVCESTLSSRVGLIVSSSDEDVDGRAVVALLQGQAVGASDGEGKNGDRTPKHD